MFNLKDVLKNFKIEGDLISAEPYGFGHINSTYLVVYNNKGQQKRYIVQKINTKLFNNVDNLMSNIAKVCDFNRERIIKNGGNPDRESLTIIRTKDGKPYYKTEDNEYYRVYIFIEDTVAYQVVKEPKDFYYSAVAFGNFANLLSEFDASSLYEIIPNFHNTAKRFSDFKEAVKKDAFNRVKDCQKEIDFIMEREHYYNKIVDLLNSGEMPTRVTHNDTKLNNVLLDSKTGEPVCVIDLDTIMPGSLCYDFGDSIRFGCNPCSEDEKDLSKVNFSFDLYKIYLEGYMSTVKDSITQIEKDNLALGAIMMTIECGMRFLADYLSGDTYFKTHREGQNLDRARTQLKLVSDMEKRFDEMNALVK